MLFRSMIGTCKLCGAKVTSNVIARNRGEQEQLYALALLSHLATAHKKKLAFMYQQAGRLAALVGMTQFTHDDEQLTLDLESQREEGVKWLEECKLEDLEVSEIQQPILRPPGALH